MKIYYRLRSIVRAGVLCALCSFIIVPSPGQNLFEETIEQITSDNVRGYLQPMMDGFGANINSGFPGSARIGKMGVSVRVQFVAMGTLIGDSEKNFMATPPAPFPQEPVQTATIFGGTGSVAEHPNYPITYKFQDGIIDASLIPFAVPQITVGNVFGTQMTIRYVPIPELDDFPKINLFGIGFRHSVSQYLPLVPVDLAAGIFYQTFSIGDFIDTKAWALSAQVSRTFLLVTVYGGLQYETTNVDVSYRYEGPLPPGDMSDRDVSVSFKGENRFRVTAGAGLSLGILHLHTDISVGKVTAISAGLGFGI